MHRELRNSMCSKCHYNLRCGWLENVGPRTTCEHFKSPAEAEELSTQVSQLISWMNEKEAKPCSPKEAA